MTYMNFCLIILLPIINCFQQEWWRETKVSSLLLIFGSRIG